MLPTQRVKSIYSNKDTKFFLIKSYSEKNVQISQVYNIWATTPKNERKFVEAFMENSYVVLIFSVNGSSKFCGYAIMESKPGESKNKNVYFYYDQKIFKGKNFDIQWIRIVDLPFIEVQNLTNSLNENKSIKVGRDGQEIERNAGVKLCEMFELHLEKMKNMGVDIFTGVTLNNINQSSNLNQNKNTLNTNGNITSNSTNANHNNFTNHMNGNSNITLVHARAHQEMYPNNTNFMLNNVNKYNDVHNIYNTNASGMDVEWVNFRNLYNDSQFNVYSMYNPALGVFPVDVSNMSYDDYISCYENSQAIWRLKMTQNEIKY